ncbi:hypothetical protein DTO271D3_4231 [Paecilomyces variotii]|nr:hypothetical protein DTO169C6_4296 [Paecilomyces variotii]KAJ9315658.1 hypothetical protein DTO271D3_4231 [Paecilomyces variotii]KAJ9406876.1 hypothetical protein DTO045G8_5542 [Paecilomyces variotii]
MEYLRPKISIPIPKILSWNHNPSNRVGWEYILKKHVEGISLHEKWPFMDMRFMYESCFVNCSPGESELYHGPSPNCGPWKEISYCSGLIETGRARIHKRRESEKLLYRRHSIRTCTSEIYTPLEDCPKDDASASPQYERRVKDASICYQTYDVAMKGFVTKLRLARNSDPTLFCPFL